MFEKTLVDLVKGIRSNKKNEERYISQCIAEIKEELRSSDTKKKAVAVQKATYLRMIGYDVSWASFHIVEVMSQPRFSYKRIGYLAASVEFDENTDVLLLTTNQLKKDMKSNNQYEAGVAINALSNMCSMDLGKDLVADVVALLGSTKAYVKKKAVLVLYKIFLKYPEALRPAFPQLEDKLKDEDPSVQSAAVNVICELSRKNPKNYLALAKRFFEFLSQINNNWTLIKIVKLFGALTPLEPRLGKKLIDPLSHLMNTTQAKSLLYECVRTVTIGLSEHLPIMKLAVEKLRSFVEDPDQNLKYLGLLGLGRVMKVYPKMISDMRETVLECLDDEDVTIRARALDLLSGMVNKKNIVDIIRRMMKHVDLSEGDVRNDMILKIIETCSQNNYQYIMDFKWYLDVLVELTQKHGNCYGKLISEQLLDVAIRVKSVRAEAVAEMLKLLSAPHLVNETPKFVDLYEVLYAAAWIVGEFSSYVADAEKCINGLLNARVPFLPSHIQAVYLQSIIKVFASICSGRIQDKLSQSKIETMKDGIQASLNAFLISGDVEVQERATLCSRILDLHGNMLKSGVDIGPQIAFLFDEELNPVASKAQKKVPIPEGLDLDKEIFGEDISDSSEEEKEEEMELQQEERAEEERRDARRAAEERKKRRKNDPYYLPTSPGVEEIPVEKLSEDVLGGELIISEEETKHKKKGKRGKRKGKEEPDKRLYTVSAVEEMPENVVNSSSEDEKSSEDSLSRIDLTKPADAHIELYSVKEYNQADLTAKQEKVRREHEVHKKHKREERKRRKGEKERGKDREKEKEKHKKDKKNKEKKEKHSKREETPQNQTSQNLLEIEDILGTSTTSSSQKRPAARPGKNEDLLDELFGTSASATTPTTPQSSGLFSQQQEVPLSLGENKNEGKSHKKEKKSSKKKKSESERNVEVAQTQPREVLPTSSPHSNYVELYDDSSVKIGFTPVAKLVSSNTCGLALTFTNISGSDISDIEVDFVDSINTRLVRSSQGAPVKAGFSLSPGESRALPLSFTVMSCVHSQQVKGTVGYTLEGESSKTGSFTLPINASLFMVAMSLAEPEFDNLSFSACQFAATAKIRVGEDLGEALKKIAYTIKVGPVAHSGNIAKFYGKTVQEQHVAVIIKAVSSDAFNVEVRSSVDALPSSLLGEIKGLFKRRKSKS